jgi:LDH2 family malate/lactate/ureidoglycolate dehydrogenase
MSSHKGYGLALMVHILGGTLSGASFSPIRVKTQKPSDPDRLGHFFLAIDPKAFRPEGAFEDDLDAVIDVLHATTAIDPRCRCSCRVTPKRRRASAGCARAFPCPGRCSISCARSASAAACRLSSELPR